MSFEDWFDKTYGEYEQMDGFVKNNIHYAKGHARRAWDAGFDYCLKMLAFYKKHPTKKSVWIKEFLEEQEEHDKRQ